MPVTINGDGLIDVGGTSTTQGRVRLAEDTDNGSNYIELTAPAAVTSNRTVTFPDATGTVALTSDLVSGGTRGQAFTSNGTFTIPTGVTTLKVTLVGGGGGGAGGAVACCVATVGTGGSGAATAFVYLTGLTPGNTIGVTIGGAGTAGGTASNGGAGGNSSIQSGTQTITTVTAGGGGAGRYNTTANAPGTATNATYSTPGQYGIQTSYSGGPSLMGFGGMSSPNTGAVGYGAGGRGLFGPGSGAVGTAGIVIFEW